MEFHENAIEWVNGQKTVTITLSNQKLRNKVYKYKEQFPDEVEIISDKEGTMYAHIPLSYIRINRPPKRELTEEQRQELRERFQKIRERKNKHEK